MVSKSYITREEANSIKNEIKLELTNEDTERRHEDRSKLNRFYFTVDELEKANIKTSMSMENMEKSIGNIEKKMEEWFHKLFAKFDWLDNTYVRKDEHAENRERIKALELEVKLANSKVQNIDIKMAWWGGAIAIIAFIIPFISDKFIK